MGSTVFYEIHQMREAANLTFYNHCKHAAHDCPYKTKKVKRNLIKTNKANNNVITIIILIISYPIKMTNLSSVVFHKKLEP